MATTLTREGIDKRIKVLERGVASLPAGIRLWDEPGPRTDERQTRQAAFRAEWADLMDRFDTLVSTHGKALFSEDQALRLRELAIALAGAARDIERLGLRMPRNTGARHVARASTRARSSGRV
jgi:hypothetical protein